MIDRRKIEPLDSGPPLSPIPEIPDKLKGGWQLAMPMILAIYLALAILNANMVPLAPRGYQNAPDEPAHLLYVHIISEGRLPSKLNSEASKPFFNTDGDQYESYEWHQPPLYYALAASILPLGERSIRYLSIVIGFASTLLVFQAGRWLIPSRPMAAILASGIVAFTPGHIAISSVVNNDALLEFFFSAWCLVVIHSLNGGLTPVRARWLGLIMAGAALTKATAILLIPLTVFALFLMWRNGEALKNIGRGILWIAGIVFTLSGWWFIRNYQLYHEFLPIKTFQASFTGTARAIDVVHGKLGLPVFDWPSYFQLVGSWSFQSFWATFGTSKSRIYGVPYYLAPQIYQILGIVCLIAIGGMIRLHFRKKLEFTQTQLYCLWILFGLLGIVACSFLMYICTYFQAQGRYLYPAMLPIALCISMGWRSLIPLKYENSSSFLLLGLLLVVCFAYYRVL